MIMLVLRGISDRTHPRGLLDDASAIAYAQAVGYAGEVLDVAGDTRGQRPQIALAVEQVESRPEIGALYGFSGGGYNLVHIWKRLSAEARSRIAKVVVVGSPGVKRSDFYECRDVIIFPDPPQGHMAGPAALLRTTVGDQNMSQWPRDSQDALISFYGNPGSASFTNNLVRVKPPFRMTYEGKPVPALLFHKKAADALSRALQKVWDYYGHDQARIDKLGISKTAGTYNKRMVRGSNSKWSNHAYGAAIDINAEENGFNVAGNIPTPMIAAFKSEGARWGGDYRGRKDPMHFEFCSSGEPQRTFEQWLSHYGAHQPANPVLVSSRVAEQGSSDRRTRMGETIFGYEARLDSDGNVRVYDLPANDGGGAWEVAGINVRYHPQQAAALRRLVEQGRQKEARASAIEYILKYTDWAAGVTTNAGVEFFLRDCGFNRGQGGATKILQMALGVEADGRVGPETRGALAKIGPTELLDRLRVAREKYENIVAPGRPNMRDGLRSRWDKCLRDARRFATETPTATTGSVAAAAGTVAAGTAGAAVSGGLDAGWGVVQWSILAGCVLAALVLLYVGYLWWKHRNPSRSLWEKVGADAPEKEVSLIDQATEEISRDPTLGSEDPPRPRKKRAKVKSRKKRR